jgi:hypothetical protein
MNPDVVAFKASNRGHDSGSDLAPRFTEPRRMRIKFDRKLATRAASRVSEAYPGALFPLPTTRFARGGRGEEKLDIPRNAAACCKDGFRFALPRAPGVDSPRAAFAAVEEIQTPQSSGLAVCCRRPHAAWHRFCFVRFARENSRRRNRKGENTGSDGSFIDRIALPPISRLPGLGIFSCRSRI